jgi:hypothetical protein
VVNDLPVAGRDKGKDKGGKVPDPPPPPPHPQTTTAPPPPVDPPTPEEVVPTAVTATARPDGTVLVGWTPGPKKPSRFNVFYQPTDDGVPVRGAGSRQVAQAPGNATSAVVTTLQPGTVGAFFVLGVPPGYQQGQTLPSSPLSNEVATYARPGAPTNIRLGSAMALPRTDVNGNGRMQFAELRWDAAPANGRPVTNYRITIQVDTLAPVVFQTRATSYRNLTVPCSDRNCMSQDVHIEVAAINEAGDGEPGVLDATLTPVQPRTDPDPGNGSDPGKENGGGEPK